jgi:hypothetical protein
MVKGRTRTVTEMLDAPSLLDVAAMLGEDGVGGGVECAMLGGMLPDNVCRCLLFLLFLVHAPRKSQRNATAAGSDVDALKAMDVS